MSRGYTMIELVAVVLLLGVLAASTAISLVPVAEGFLQVRSSARAMQKSRLAVARLSREFTAITNIAASGPRDLTYTFIDPSGASQQRTLSWGGAPGDDLMLNAVPLTDDVGFFELRYHPHGGAAQAAWSTNCQIIELLLTNQTTDSGFINRIAPRNLLYKGAS